MAKAIEAHEVLVKDLFGKSYQFTIPAYQRPYSWLKEHATQLFEDIREPALIPGPLNTLKDYFVGSMVLVKQPHSVTAEVIDGQQRLTTITILLSALRHMSTTRAIMTGQQSFATSLNEFIYEPGNFAAGVTASYRLAVRATDQTFFLNHIQLPGGIATIPSTAVLPDSQKRMVDVVKVFLDKLAPLSEQELIRFSQYLLQKIYVATVQTGDEEAAFRIFSVLNDRGLKLSTADILKAEIIGALAPELRDVYSKKWEECEEALGTEDFDLLFAHIRMIGVRKKAALSTVKEVREYLRPKDQPENFIDNVLIPLAEVMEELKDGEVRASAKQDEINDIVDWLQQLTAVNYIGHIDWVPVALEMVRRLRSTPDQLLESLRLLESLTFGMMVLRRSSSARMERYGLILKDMDSTSPEKCPSLAISAAEKTEILQRLNGDVYEEYYCRYLLKRLDKVTAGVGAQYGSSKVVTIEHILPQNPNQASQWFKDFPSQTDRDCVVNKLGNLTLLSGKRNTAAGNRDYQDKIEQYFKRKQGHFVLTAHLVNNFKKWTLEEFTRRHRDLIASCTEIWGF